MKTKAPRIATFIAVFVMLFGYTVCKDIFKIGIKDGKQTALKMHMVKVK
ncbi:hypothetical protein ACFGVR_05095 [Mucilaginibacter sp. AW1-3]